MSTDETAAEAAEAEPEFVEPDTATIGEALSGKFSTRNEGRGVTTPRGLLLYRLMEAATSRDDAEERATYHREKAEEDEGDAKRLSEAMGDLMGAIRKLDKGTEFEEHDD